MDGSIIRHTFLAASALAGACAVAACGGASAVAHPPSTTSPAAAAQSMAAARSAPKASLSAIGQDAAGDLIYAASMSAVPADLAAALAGHGARIAMELDINPEWVQLDAAGIPGGVLTAEIAGQYRPSDQYLAGWTRDFFTVLAPPASPAGTPPPSASLGP